jgi:hypothetical protein
VSGALPFRAQIVAALSMHGSMTQKALLNLAGSGREVRDAAYQEIKGLLDAGVIEIVFRREAMTREGMMAFKNTRYALTDRSGR